ncbi:MULTISPECIES: type VI secretion system lipoprotein TssJ [unclassified Caballeronia]|uniref:type VI secretion system lipoprotein TssJ n=1 Tax=unclassified Caballeronia TaxID=2646786 RepID=UPI002028459C|nr:MULTISPECIES: type VI secretion system lipoprotein TssJ [unclassified Caballeronia]MDR5767873.1 type VI secretion system lipoprotein TssJ [Caballeronia sp. LZ028]
MRLPSAYLCYCVVALMLAACTGNAPLPPVEPLKLTLSINASSSVNLDDRKRPAPILVRVYELKNADAFNQADFYSLQDKDKTVLADDLAARDQFLLRPGESKTVVRNANDASTTLGVIAGYRDLPNAVWRATWPLPARPSAAWYRRAPRLKLTVDVDSNSISIIDAESRNK